MNKTATLFTATALATLLIGCAPRVPPPPEPRSAPLPASLIGCGTLTPNLHAQCCCDDGNREAVDYRPPILMTDKTPSIRESVEAVCSPTAKAFFEASCTLDRQNDLAVQRTFVLRGKAERDCGFGPKGSDASISPRWVIPLELPAAAASGNTYELLAQGSYARKASDGRELGADVPCTVSIAGAEPQPFQQSFTARSTINTGNANIVMDCPDLNDTFAKTGCYGYNGSEGPHVSPQSISAELRLTVSIQRPQ